MLNLDDDILSDILNSDDEWVICFFYFSLFYLLGIINLVFIENEEVIENSFLVFYRKLGGNLKLFIFVERNVKLFVNVSNVNE